MYVIDTSVISALHRNYYRSQFVTLWERFDEMVAEGRFTSTRESYRELDDGGGESFEWAQQNAGLFVTPNAKVGNFVAQIYAVAHSRTSRSSDHNTEPCSTLAPTPYPPPAP